MKRLGLRALFEDKAVRTHDGERSEGAVPAQIT